MPFQPNVILKGRPIGRSLPQMMVHIFSQWGSLMCEQGSGRAVNSPLYEAVWGELGRQWRGLSHVCHVSTLRPGLFVLMAARDWRDCGPCLPWIRVRHRRVPSLARALWETAISDCIRAAGAILFQRCKQSHCGHTWFPLQRTSVLSHWSSVRRPFLREQTVGLGQYLIILDIAINLSQSFNLIFAAIFGCQIKHPVIIRKVFLLLWSLHSNTYLINWFCFYLNKMKNVTYIWPKNNVW